MGSTLSLSSAAGNAVDSDYGIMTFVLIGRTGATAPARDSDLLL
jgi:hypothetical protein